MKKFSAIVLLSLISVFFGLHPAYSARAVRDMPLEACIILGDYDPKAAAYVIETRDKLIKARNPGFLSAEEAGSLEEAERCDVAIRIGQPGTWAVQAEIFSPQTKEKLFSAEASGFFTANKIFKEVILALQEGTPLERRLTRERKLRLAKQEAKLKEEPEKKPEPAVRTQTGKSDVDELPATPAAGIRQNKNAYAVVIGIEQYRQNLPRADFAAADAQTVSAYLTRVLGYPEEHVITLLNDRATNVDLAKYFERWLPNNVEKDGTVFIYFSGHGAPDPKTGNAFLVPYDGDPVFIAETGYSLKRMYGALGRLPAREIIVALDSCFSGAGGRSVLAKGARPLVMNLQASAPPARNVTVLAASSGDQVSSTYLEKGHGLFTYFILKGIKNEDVLRPDGSIAIGDLFGYVKLQVERIARKQYNNEQVPQLIRSREQ